MKKFVKAVVVRTLVLVISGVAANVAMKQLKERRPDLFLKIMDNTKLDKDAVIAEANDDLQERERAAAKSKYKLAEDAMRQAREQEQHPNVDPTRRRGGGII
jgi:hypothetical protein